VAYSRVCGGSVEDVVAQERQLWFSQGCAWWLSRGCGGLKRDIGAQQGMWLLSRVCDGSVVDIGA
jgi:hypothetical protein